ncbi:MAG: RNA 2',3'-cyclic phosphodiesterase [Gemmataceae bacterium]|nr:RNA 2',3'-cyclic phosphodiesterase [Gemmataceae bacterium]
MFVAIDVAPFTRDRLRGLQDQFGPRTQGVRWVDPANFHCTLVFLGETVDRDVVKVCRAVEQVARARPPFSFTLTGVGAFPTPRRPRTLIARVGEGAEELTALHGQLETALEDLGLYQREERAFTPHVTLGRVQGEPDPELIPALVKFAAWEGGETKVREIRVMSSELRPDGPEYAVLGRARLAGN